MDDADLTSEHSLEAKARSTHDCLVQLARLEQHAQKLKSTLMEKEKRARTRNENETDALYLAIEYLRPCKELKTPLEQELVSKSEILVAAIEEQQRTLEELQKRAADVLGDEKNKLYARELILKNQKEKYEKERDDTIARVNLEKQRLEEERNAALAVVAEKSKGFPWIADAWADYLHLKDLKKAEELETKGRPAISAARQIREIALEKRILAGQFRTTRNIIRYYESLFPWLEEFLGEDVDDLISQISKGSEDGVQDDDPVRFYLTKGEYDALTVTERNQRALDRYWLKKNPWELGRDYERYIGYMYESDGYRVYYQGIEEGLEDLGRDLIAAKGSTTKVIQCKYWAQHRIVHEKHICQLFGTTLKYWVEQRHQLQKYEPDFLLALMHDKQINGVFITSTRLSEVAKDFARELGVEVREQVPFERYPSIKCNQSKATGEKIYHLPMDQQYDRVKMVDEEHKYYVSTVAEAESLGFRRAYRWRGPSD